MDTDELRHLVALAQAGDGEAWERLYRHVYPRLRAYVSRQVGGGAVDDVVSETMTRAVGGIGRFRWQPAAGFDAWVFGIARRASADHYRSAHRFRRAAPGDDSTVTLPAPGAAFELAEDHAEIRSLFALLAPAEREVLELRVIAGLSSEETATVLGKRAGAVRTAQSRALAHLRQLMEECR